MWQNWTPNVLQSASERPFVPGSEPIAVGFPADCEWHRLPAPLVDDGDAADVQATVVKPAPVSVVASRRSARLARDAKRAREAELARLREQREPRGAEAAWAAKRERILKLIAQDAAEPSELKRELRRLLDYAEAVQAAVRTERAELASDLTSMVAPLLHEVSRLQGRLAVAEGKTSKEGIAEVPPTIEVDDSVEDTLRASRNSEAAANTAIAPPPPETRAVEHAGSGGASDASVRAIDGGASRVSEVALSRRERQGVQRRVQEAARAVAQGGNAATLVEMMRDYGSGPAGRLCACAAVEVIDSTLLQLGASALGLKKRLQAAHFGDALLHLLDGAEVFAAPITRAALHALESYTEGLAAGAMSIQNAAGAAKLHGLLRAWTEQYARQLATADTSTSAATVLPGRSGDRGARASRTGDAESGRVQPVHEAGARGDVLLPQLLLAIVAIAEAAEEPRASLVRAGVVESLLELLDGDAASEVTVLAVEALKALRVSKIAYLCTDTPQRLATLRAVWAMDRLFSPIAAARRTPAHVDGEDGGDVGGGSVSARGSAPKKLTVQSSDGGAAITKTSVADSPDGAASTALVPAPRLTADQADELILRCHADGLRVSSGLGEGKPSNPFVTVAVELRWGSLVEIGRAEPVADANPWWEELCLELPDGVPARAYLRFAVYEWQRSGRHRLIGVAGATIEQLHDAEPGGRGVALALRSTPPAATARRGYAVAPSRGTIWIERCELVQWAAGGDGG